VGESDSQSTQQPKSRFHTKRIENIKTRIGGDSTQQGGPVTGSAFSILMSQANSLVYQSHGRQSPNIEFKEFFE